MSAEFKSIDDQIKALYQSASQVETQTRQLEARIAKIDGTKHLPTARRYDQPVGRAIIRSNLTLTSFIAQDYAELAHFCAINLKSSQGRGRSKPEPMQRNGAG